MARAIYQGTIIAESDDVKVVEGITYFPIDSVDQTRLVDSPLRTQCF